MSKLILVIDDDPVERAILERVRVGADYPVRPPADGQLPQVLADLASRA